MARDNGLSYPLAVKANQAALSHFAGEPEYLTPQFGADRVFSSEPELRQYIRTHAYRSRSIIEYEKGK